MFMYLCCISSEIRNTGVEYLNMHLRKKNSLARSLYEHASVLLAFSLQTLIMLLSYLNHALFLFIMLRHQTLLQINNRETKAWNEDESVRETISIWWSPVGWWTGNDDDEEEDEGWGGWGGWGAHSRRWGCPVETSSSTEKTPHNYSLSSFPPSNQITAKTKPTQRGECIQWESTTPFQINLFTQKMHELNTVLHSITMMSDLITSIFKWTKEIFLVDCILIFIPMQMRKNET